jgi:hypothetical protein
MTLRKLENISKLKNNDDGDINDQEFSKSSNHITHLMSMELMNEVGREMMN